jgi:hypothetical protein
MMPVTQPAPSGETGALQSPCTTPINSGCCDDSSNPRPIRRSDLERWAAQFEAPDEAELALFDRTE